MITEAVVSFVVEKIGDFLVHQGAALFEVHDKIAWVKAELEWMQDFLKDADTKQNDARLKRWVSTVRDIAYKAEDVIDNFILQIEQSRRRPVNYIQSFTSFVDEPSARNQLGKKIEEIKNELTEIIRRRKTYGIENLSKGGEGSSSISESLREQRRTSPLLEDTEVVGFQDDIKTLVERLIEGESRRCVISIVGMGGLGKTTLARKVYNHDDVKKHFHGCAWIYVSQEYDARDLLQSIMRCFRILTTKHHKMNITELKEVLFKRLKARRYFLVLDDIWKTEAWNTLVTAFPDSNNGSRILLTTRNKEVASFADPRSHPHELPFLRQDESWELFCKKTFLRQEINCPQILERLGRQIVEKCHGLPLAIILIAGLLSRKTGLPSEWDKVLKSISWQFAEGEAQISRILALSYEDLSYHLKPCFLYLGVYPEEHVFSARELIQLWVAEGFVHSRGAETLEEVAEDYLMELIQRSLIQIVQRSSIGVKRCRIHDLLRDLSISKANEENFLCSTNTPPPCTARRLAIYPDSISLNDSYPCLRSLICFGPKPRYLRQDQLRGLQRLGALSPKSRYLVQDQLRDSKSRYLGQEQLRDFQLLRVLHLHEIGVKGVPNEICTLIHLRYLQVAVDAKKCKNLLAWIANLFNLQTLHIATIKSTIEVRNLQTRHMATIKPRKLLQILRGTTTKVYEEILLDIDCDILKMQNLRHVRVELGRFTGWSVLSFPSNLQTLKYIKADDWMGDDCLGKLINLRKLGIAEVDMQWHGDILFYSIPKLKHLQSLTLLVSPGGSLYPFPPILNLLHLYKLCLGGGLEKLPESHEFSPNLTKLTLQDTTLGQDPMPTLEKLQNLRILRLLHSSYMGKEMVCSVQGFPRLESLKLKKLDYFEGWRVEEGAMPCLLHLRIYQCRQLKMLPEGLQHVTSLRKLEITLMSQIFIDRLGGEDFHKIQHIPSIDIKRSFRARNG